MVVTAKWENQVRPCQRLNAYAHAFLNTPALWWMITLGKAEVRHLKITLNKSALSEGDVDRTGAWRKESVGDLLQSHIQMSKERLLCTAKDFSRSSTQSQGLQLPLPTPDGAGAGHGPHF